MPRFAEIALRVLVPIVGILCTWQAVRFARIDWASAGGTAEGFAQALRMDPENPELLARAALLRNDNGDNSPEVDDMLRRAVRLNPLDSRTLIVLGLREEFRGDKAGAERDLLQAVAVDRQFTPAWSLASFYFRSGRHDRFWPVVERVLQLDPLLVDLTPLFDLCWRESDDPVRILSVLPRREGIVFPYLRFLVDTQRTEAAAQLAPVALSVADRTKPEDRAPLLGLVDILLREQRAREAAGVWNQLVDRNMVRGGKIEPEKGAPLADPTFEYPSMTQGFGWRIERMPGTFASIDRNARFELDGNEPEKSLLLWTPAVVVPGRAWRLVWKIDTSRLSSPDDPGLLLQVVRRAGEQPIAQCRLAQSTAQQPTAGTRSCNFDAPPGVDHVQVQVSYERAQGTVRIKGVFQIFELRLQFAS